MSRSGWRENMIVIAVRHYGHEAGPIPTSRRMQLTAGDHPAKRIFSPVTLACIGIDVRVVHAAALALAMQNSQ